MPSFTRPLSLCIDASVGHIRIKEKETFGAIYEILTPRNTVSVGSNSSTNTSQGGFVRVNARHTRLG